MFSINFKKNLLLHFTYKIIQFLRCRFDLISTGAFYYYLVKDLKKIGSEVIFDYNVKILNPLKTSIGNGVFIGRDVIINAYDEIIIGDGCAIGAGCKLISGNHDINDLNLREGKIIIGEVVLEESVWLGYNVVILPGVNLGKGCIVAAGAVVTKSFEEYSIIGGVPARLIKKRVIA